MFGQFMFKDCPELVSDKGFAYDPDNVSYEFAKIDYGEPYDRGYLTGKEGLTPAGQLNYSYDVVIKKGNIPYKDQTSIFEVPWDENTLPDDGHYDTTDTS